MKIVFQGITDFGNFPTKAFPFPGAGQPIVYEYNFSQPTYAAYLVQIVERNVGSNTIKFVPIDRSDPTPYAAGDDLYEVDLTDSSLVWSALPSTLDGWSQTSNSAILFLTSDFISGKETAFTPAAADDSPDGDPNKWPAGAGGDDRPFRTLVAMIKRHPKAWQAFLDNFSAKQKSEMDAFFAEYEY